MKFRSRILAGLGTRWALALLMVGGLLCTTGEPNVPSALAAFPGFPEPLARVMLKLHSIYVLDDSEWGTAELNYTVTIQRVSPQCGGACAKDKFTYTYSFDGDADMTKSFDGSPVQFLPFYRPPNPQFYTAPELGLALYAGDSLLMKWKGIEEDPGFDDYLGSIQRTFNQDENWGMGTVHEISSRDTLGFGGYTVTFEIVLAPLPDLIPTDLRVGNFADNGDDIVCVMVENGGSEPAGPYTTRFYVDGVMPRNGELHEAGVLAPGGHLERCFQTTIAAGEHLFEARVDEDQKLAELNERNNRKATLGTIARAGVGGQTLPVFPRDVTMLEPSNGGASNSTGADLSADLVTLTIRVKGKVPDGQSDCDPGKNDVDVVVKNQGSVDAGAFKLGLLVDGSASDGGVEKVTSLSKGQQTTIHFDDVKLKKGTHQITVRLDTEARVSESTESNNQLSVTVNCQDE